MINTYTHKQIQKNHIKTTNLIIFQFYSSIGIGYSLSVSGNDGHHPDVVSKVTVEFIPFSNTTVENSITMQISRLRAADFLSKYYRALLELLQEEMDIGDTLNIFSIDEKENHIEVYMAISSPQGRFLISLPPSS